ncbi:MAG: hypothetical protein HQ538_04010 [Parcubacteria group bacterium]|nr:hypothetical protein [Parcubacteria group bacterium]
MNTKKNLIKNRVYVQREIGTDYVDGKINKNEFYVLMWVLLHTNPYQGHFTADYRAIEPSGTINYDSARKIISNLRKKGYVLFSNHKGRTGKFHIYPIDFLLTNGNIQTFEYIKDKMNSTNKLQLHSKVSNKKSRTNHNIEAMKKDLVSRFSANKQEAKITTTYNNNDNENNNDNIDSKKTFKRIDPNTFEPRNAEEQRCKDIALELGETDMNFILSCKRNYGVNIIEKARGDIKEAMANGVDVKNLGGLFNSVVKELGEKSLSSDIEE